MELGKLVQEICAPLVNTRPGICLRIQNAPHTVKGNPVKLAIAFRNIIENAVKFSEDQTKPVEIDIENTANDVRITIRDYGIGISEREVQGIFEPFSRLDKSRSHSKPGFGPGLNIAKKIIDSHAGQIIVHTHNQEMTEFVVILRSHSSDL